MWLHFNKQQIEAQGGSDENPCIRAAGGDRPHFRCARGVAGKCREGQPRAVGMKSTSFFEPSPKCFVFSFSFLIWRTRCFNKNKENKKGSGSNFLNLCRRWWVVEESNF
jgi:hypothetical protein